jgi:tRNA 2-thiouridine synthesizing protein A
MRDKYWYDAAGIYLEKMHTMADLRESFARHLDVTGLRCPLPLLKAKKALGELEVGEVLKVSATDPGSQRDFQAYVDHTSHKMIEAWEENGVFWYLMERGE